MLRRPQRQPFRVDPLDVVALSWLVVWTLVALLARPAGDYGVETDFYGDFAVYARQWMDGRPTAMNGFRGPLYYLVLGGIGTLLGDLFLAAKLISVVSGAIGIRLLGGLLRKLWDERVALAGALFLAANAVHIEYSYRACSDILFFALFAGTLHAIFTAPDRLRNWILAGVFAGLAWLTRYNGLALVPAAIGAAFIMKGVTRRAAAGAGAYALTFIAVITPWALFLLATKGDPFWNQAFENTAIEVLAGNPHVAQTGRFMSTIDVRSVSEIFEVSPALFLAALGRNLFAHFWNDVRELVEIFWAIPAVAGLVLAGRNRGGRARLAFAWTALVTYASLLPVFYSNRFMLPLLIWWAAGFGCFFAALAGLSGGAHTIRKHTLLQHAATVLLLLATLAATIRGVKGSVHPDRHGGRAVEIARLAGNARKTGAPFGPDHPIAARKPHIGYYLESPVLTISSVEFSGIRESGAHYLLVSGAEVRAYPALRRFMTPTGPGDAPPGFGFVAQGTWKVGDAWQVATLYRVLDPLPAPPPAPGTPAGPAHQGLSRLDGLRLDLLRWYLKWNNLVHADRIASELSAAAGRHPEVLLTLGDLALERHRYADAERFYNQVVEAVPGHRKARTSLAGVRYLAGDPDACDAMLQEMIREAGTEGLSDLYRDWRSWYDTMEYAAALAPVLLAIGINNAPGNRIPLAYVLHGLDLDTEARGVLEDVLAEEPGNVEAGELLKRLDEDLEPPG